MATAVFIITALLCAGVVLAWRILRRLELIDRHLTGQPDPHITPGFERAHGPAPGPPAGPPDTFGKFIGH